MNAIEFTLSSFKYLTLFWLAFEIHLAFCLATLNRKAPSFQWTYLNPSRHLFVPVKKKKTRGHVTGYFEHIHLRLNIYIIIIKLQRRTHTHNHHVLLLRANDSWKRIQKVIPESPKNLPLIALSFYACRSKIGPSVHHEIVVNPTARDELFKILREREGWVFENNSWKKKGNFYLCGTPSGKASCAMKNTHKLDLSKIKCSN